MSTSSEFEVRKSAPIIFAEIGVEDQTLVYNRDNEIWNDKL